LWGNGILYLLNLMRNFAQCDLHGKKKSMGTWDSPTNVLGGGKWPWGRGREEEKKGLGWGREGGDFAQ
jgi:hypothetical protein